MPIERDFSPIGLLVEDQEWTARSIESILGPRGYSIFKAYTGAQARKIIRRIIPDLIIVRHQLPDYNGHDLIRELREEETVFPSTPILVLRTSHPTSAERIDALQAGAWSILKPPLDPEELVLRLDTYTAAKRDAEFARRTGLVDPGTGVYNFNGLMQRVDEILAAVRREETHLSFITLGPADPAFGLDDEKRHADQLAEAVRAQVRKSDVVARVGPLEFMIVAPRTNESGARILVERVRDRLVDSPLEVRAGTYSVHVDRNSAAVSVDLLSRATAELRKAQNGLNGTGTEGASPRFN